MEIAIDISPLHTGHKVRGTGFYLTHLLDSLTQEFPEQTFHQFTDHKLLPRTTDVVHYPYFDPFFFNGTV